MVEGSSLFFTLIQAFCRMLDNIPQDQAFTHLIITQLVTYHDKCSTWYKGRTNFSEKFYHMLTASALVSRARAEGGACLKPAAALVDSGDLAVIVKTIWSGDDADRERLLQKVPSNLLPILMC